MSDRLFCPVHGIPDCSPLLNGCSEVIRLHDRRETVAEPHTYIVVKYDREDGGWVIYRVDEDKAGNYVGMSEEAFIHGFSA